MGNHSVESKIEIQHFYRPIVVEEPDLVVGHSTWNGLIPFAFWVVDAVRPRAIVELGTESGVSYCAFCQAVSYLKLPAACFAVDTWKGDAHTGPYGEEVFQTLVSYHDPRYGSFSRLVRTTFDEVVQHFADGSIDLLHIDGYHTYDAVSHDFYTWLPKLSQQGVVLLHDTNVREMDFGVWRLWDELRGLYPSFSLIHSHGLGVLAVGKEVPPPIRWLTGHRNEDSHETNEIRAFFARLGKSILLKNELSDRNAELASVQGTLGEREAYIQEIHSGHAWRLLTQYFKFRERLLPQGTKRRLLAKTIFRRMWSVAQTMRGIGRINIRTLLYLKNFRSLASPWIFKNPRGRADKLSLPEGQQRLLVVDQQIPAPDQDAGSVRMYAILKLLREMDYAATFVSNSELRMFEYERELRRLGIRVVYGYSTAVEHLTRYGHQYEFVVLSRPEVAFRFLPAVRAYALNSTVIYDTVDLHWVRLQRAAELSDDPVMRYQADRFKRIERLNAICADLVFAVTQEDKDSLLAVAPDVRVEIIPTIHTPMPPSDLGQQRKGLMFIGGFQHAPNVDAVKWFVTDVFPLIQRQLTGIVFHVVGSRMPEEVTILASPSVRIAGYVPDPEPYFRSSRVFVAPLRYGAGMKGKIGQSMSYGLPVVTTSVGAEGFMLRDGENALIGDDPEAFARAVLRLHTDNRLWRKIADNSVKHVREYFSEEVVKARLGTILAGLNGADRGGTLGRERAA